MMGENIIFGDIQIEREDLEELAFNSANVADSKDSSASRPMDVLQRGIVKKLRVGC